MALITNKEARKQIFDKTGGLCSHCTDMLDDVWHVDHYHPQSKGGLDIIENLIPSCGPCNTRKRDRIPEIESTEEYLKLFYNRFSVRKELSRIFDCDYEDVRASVRTLDQIHNGIVKCGPELVFEWLDQLMKFGIEWRPLGEAMSVRIGYELDQQNCAADVGGKDG